jgi:plastocyanin
MKTNILLRLGKSLTISSLFFFISFSLMANTILITVSDFAFSPSTASVVVGDTVKWVYVNGSHTTTSINVPSGAASWDAPLNTAGATFSYKVTVAGNYAYKCSPHFGMGMAGGFTAVSPTVINELADRKKVSFYPNPCDDFINVEFTPSKTKNTSIIVSDILGNQVYRYVAETAGSMTQKKKIDLQEIPAGVYFLSVMDDTNKQTFKLLKKKE